MHGFKADYYSLFSEKKGKKSNLLPCVESMFVSMVTGNMVRGLDEDETSFLDEVSRQQCLVEKQRRDEEKQELLEYRISFHQVFVCVKKNQLAVIT